MSLHTLSWNNEENWLACGGEGNSLRLLRMEAPQPTEQGTDAGKATLVNQSLAGHDGWPVLLQIEVDGV